jgi:hypothetical protein
MAGGETAAAVLAPVVVVLTEMLLFVASVRSNLVVAAVDGTPLPAGTLEIQAMPVRREV